jgi:hypothetical protein
MPIEVAAGFGLARGFNLSNLFGLSKGKAISVGTLIVPPPVLPLSNGPKIDHLPNAPTRWRKDAFPTESTRSPLILWR